MQMQYFAKEWNGMDVWYFPQKSLTEAKAKSMAIVNVV